MGVQAQTVTAIGQEISLACKINPTKIIGSDKLLPRLQQTYDGWRKEDPPTTKMLPVELDLLASQSWRAIFVEDSILSFIIGPRTQRSRINACHSHSHVKGLGGILRLVIR